MFGLLFILFTAVPAMEIFLLFEIGGKIGALNTFAVVILTGIYGAYLAKSQGMAVLARIQNELNQGKMPGDAIVHGLLVFGGGLLLLTPGFLTDVLGFSMVMPGPRHIIAKFLKDFFERSIQNGSTQFHFYSSGMKGGNFYRYESQGQDYQQTVDQGPREVSPGVFEADFEKKQ